VAGDLRALIDRARDDLTRRLRAVLEVERAQAAEREQRRFQERQGELSTLIAETTVQRLEREIAALRAEAEQGVLFDPGDRLVELERSIAEREEEVKRRRAHYEELREQLTRERERVLRLIIPRRYALRGDAQVFPVAVEVRLPAAGGRRS
jgi:hypothetical protein